MFEALKVKNEYNIEHGINCLAIINRSQIDFRQDRHDTVLDFSGGLMWVRRARGARLSPSLTG